MKNTIEKETEGRSSQLESILFHPVTRTFVSESNNIFLSVQELPQFGSYELRQEILNSSRKYRCIIRDCIQRLESCNKTEYIDLICDIFYTIELCWHLCEILYFEPISGDVILPHLKRWIQFHSVSYETVAVKILKYQDFEETSSAVDTESLVPDYWSTVFGLLCQGNSLYACKLVERHSKANTSCFSKAIQFLKYIPEYDSTDGQSVIEIEHSWQTWKSKVKSEIDLGTFSSDKNLEIAMKIISGEPSVDKVLRKHCISWYQYMVAKLLYTQPTIKSSQLSHYVNQALIAYKASDSTELLNIVLSSLMKKDLFGSTKGFLKMADDCWCATHLTNLLQMGNLIPAHPQNNERLDKKLVLGYGTFLINSDIFWQVGVSYLKSCKEDGFNRLNSLLPEIHLKNEYVARKILTVAYQSNLPLVVQSVCTQMSEKYIGVERFVEALSWSIKGKNYDLTSSLSDTFLKNYISSGELLLVDVVEHLGANVLFVDRLMFLVKFVKFYNNKNKGELTEGLTILIDLLVNNMVPDYFKPTYFMEILNLLKNDSIQVTKTDLVQILHSIEDYSCEFESVPPDDQDIETKEKHDSFLEKVNLLRERVVSLYATIN